MYGCESWTIKKSLRWLKNDAFDLLCWRRPLRVPWIPGRSNQSIINLEYSLEGLMLKLKLQYLGHPMRRVLSLDKTDAGKYWRQEEKGMTEMRLLDSLTNSMDTTLTKLQKMVKDREAWHAVVHEIAKSHTQLSNWATMLFFKNISID